MLINERICLIINDCILIASHQNALTFIGGRVDNNNERFGETCVRELEEELGLRITSKLPKLISFYVSSNTLHALFILNVSKSDIEFVRASHVWEIHGFTLLPINKTANTDDVSNWLLDNIVKTNTCTKYVTLQNDVVSTIDKLPKHLSNDKIIQLDVGTYYIKLSDHPKLSQTEKDYLKYINSKINGYEDDVNFFQTNAICRIKYYKYKKFMYIQLSTKSITQIGEYEYDTNFKCNEINSIDDVKKLLPDGIKLNHDIVVTLKSLVSDVYAKLNEFGLKNVKNASFYYLDKDSFYSGSTNFPMFDINDFDYLKPIQKLEKYFDGSTPNYYSHILQKYKDLPLAHPLYLYDFDYELDELLLQYVKCIPNMSIMIVWSVANISKSDITKSSIYGELEKNGDIHAIKEIVVTQKQLQGIIYQAYYDKGVFKQFEAVKSKAFKCGSRNNQNRLFIIFYVAKNRQLITGTDAPFKVQLRKILKSESGNKEDIKDNLYLHISDTFSEAIELAQLFCNKNSMRLLQYQRLDRLMKGNYWKSFTFFMTLKSFMHSLIKPIDHIRFMLFSSIVLFSLGLRNVNDIDLIIHNLPNGANTQTPSFFNVIETYLENENTKFPFVVDGVSIKGRNGWVVGGDKEYLIDWFEKDWPSLFGAASLDDIILNPKFHYYFFGMKIVSIEGDTKRRIQRSRPASYADLLAMKFFVDDKLIIPPIPDGYWKSHVYYDFTEKEKQDLVKKIIYYMKFRYNIKLEPKSLSFIVNNKKITK